VRRFEGDAVRFLLARRSTGRPPLERELERGALGRIDVGPLSLGATRRLLSERLGLNLPRPLLRRLVDATLGNPLFAIEVGRMLVERGLPAIGEDIPVPDAVEDILGARVGRLPPAERKLLLAIALSANLRTAELEAVGGPEAVEDAIATELLVVEGDRVRAAHPLLAAAAKRRARPRERPELHFALAGCVADEELRALHLALATDRPDATLAATVAAAAAGASTRGARQEAVLLAEHALRLTPPDAGERGDRFLALAGYMGRAGDVDRLTELLTPKLDALPAGVTRARGCCWPRAATSARSTSTSAAWTAQWRNDDQRGRGRQADDQDQAAQAAGPRAAARRQGHAEPARQPARSRRRHARRQQGDHAAAEANATLTRRLRGSGHAF
jgi:hypothetical protein